MQYKALTHVSKYVIGWMALRRRRRLEGASDIGRPPPSLFVDLIHADIKGNCETSKAGGGELLLLKYCAAV